MLSKMNQYQYTHINFDINNDINNDLQSVPLNSVPLQTYSMLGPLLTNELSENLDFSDMPDLESVPLDSDDDLPPVFICEYQAKEKAKTESSKKSLDEIKQNIEKTFNFNDISEGMEALNNPDILLNRIQEAYDSFKSQVGRPMTSLEMREMMG